MVAYGMSRASRLEFRQVILRAFFASTGLSSGANTASVA